MRSDEPDKIVIGFVTLSNQNEYIHDQNQPI